MEILEHPHDKLRKKCQTVEVVDLEMRDFAKLMYKTMKANNGIGLAAPQVGRLIRLIVVNNNGQPLYIFNPNILAQSKENITMNEGCLSFPDKFLDIDRPKSISMNYIDFNGKITFNTFSGLTARVIQHEIDHLDGKLFIDYEKGLDIEDKK